MPVVGLETAGLLGRSVYTATGSALHMGYRHLDTATAYRNKAEAGRGPRQRPGPVGSLRGMQPAEGRDLTDPTLVTIAATNRVTSAQVVLRWHPHRDIAVIPKSADPDHVGPTWTCGASR